MSSFGSRAHKIVNRWSAQHTLQRIILSSKFCDFLQSCGHSIKLKAVWCGEQDVADLIFRKIDHTLMIAIYQKGLQAQIVVDAAEIRTVA